MTFKNIELEKTIKLMQEDSDYKDFEDTLQYIIAKDIGCEVIISNDKDFISKELPLYNPKEFVNNFL